MSEKVTVEVVRVFTDENGDFGNELGIVVSSEASRGREQAIAAELGFSETVFIDAIANGRASIQIFTPAGELPFAGHPSVGTAWWLRNQGTPISVLAEKAGDVPVRYNDLTHISGRAEWAPVFARMPLPTPAAVTALNPAEFLSGSTYAFAWIDEAAGTLRARMFGPEHGIIEDEATGSAAVAVTTWLGRDLDITQGLGSRIVTRQAADGLVEIGGRTVWDRRLTLDI